MLISLLQKKIFIPLFRAYEEIFFIILEPGTSDSYFTFMLSLMRNPEELRERKANPFKENKSLFNVLEEFFHKF